MQILHSDIFKIICSQNTRYFLSFKNSNLEISLSVVFIIFNYFLYLLDSISKQGFNPKHAIMGSNKGQKV